jgi:hypothetical protein
LDYFSAPTISLAATTAGGVRYTPSNAYDLDPSLGSTASPGFTELAAFYSTYRVTCSYIVVRFADPSTIIPISCVVLPLNIDPGGSPSIATIISWRSNPYARVGTTISGAPLAELKNFMTTNKIFGNDMTFFDDNFASPTNGAPTNNWFWGIGVYSQANIATNPVRLDVQISVGVEFFNRKELLG